MLRGQALDGELNGLGFVLRNETSTCKLIVMVDGLRLLITVL